MKLPFTLLLFALVGAIHAQNGTIDCSKYQSSYKFSGIPITIDYVVTADDTAQGGILKAQVTYEGQGYVAAGFSPDGRMGGSMAIIGLPDQPVNASNPGKYDLFSYGATLSDKQTILDGAIVQNDTHTVLTFSKYLKENGEVALDATGSNYILVAAGPSNDLGTHRYRASVSFAFQPCQEGQLASDVVAPAAAEVAIDDKKGFFKAHGVLAILAWGVLAPLAIANSMCRHLIPGQGLWFQLHRGMNMLVLLFTTVAFVLVVKAINDTDGDDGHFQTDSGAIGKHPLIGLVVMILVLVQSIAGILRPHAPEKGEKPHTIRVVWEYGHRLCGMTLLALGWYQCHSGLVLYAERFANDKEYLGAFWGPAATIMVVAISGKMHGLSLKPEEPEQGKEDELLHHTIEVGVEEPLTKKDEVQV